MDNHSCPRVWASCRQHRQARENRLAGTVRANPRGTRIRIGQIMATQRRPYEVIAERIIELLIKLCGISAIIFVFGIFFFVFREGAPFLAKLKVGEFLFSTEWFPTSQTQPKYGVGALVVGTLSVTIVAMIIAVPFGLGAAVFVSEFCTGKVK